jgi:pimeloyl-ACP methyl ester carboxylesterase
MESQDFGGLAAVLDGEAGDPAPIVLLHGLTFDRAMWRPALDELRQTCPERRVLALDLPGHGGSPARPRYSIDSVATAVHEAAGQAGLSSPVLVGHSIAAVIATAYAARYQVSGVVNVDQWLWMEPAAAFAQSVAGEIRGGGFAGTWGTVEASMHLDMLPARAQELLRANRHVRQDLVAGYWRTLFDTPTAELADDMAATLAAVRDAGIPYLFIAGHDVEPGYRDWLRQSLPGAHVEVWPGSGHFPHLAHPGRFADRLAATANWNGMAHWSGTATGEGTPAGTGTERGGAA